MNLQLINLKSNLLNNFEKIFIQSRMIVGGNDIPMALSSSVSGNLANQSIGELIAQNNSILSALLVDYEWETVETLPEAVELMEIETYIENNIVSKIDQKQNDTEPKVIISEDEAFLTEAEETLDEDGFYGSYPRQKTENRIINIIFPISNNAERSDHSITLGYLLIILPMNAVLAQLGIANLDNTNFELFTDSPKPQDAIHNSDLLMLSSDPFRISPFSIGEATQIRLSKNRKAVFASVEKKIQEIILISALTLLGFALLAYVFSRWLLHFVLKLEAVVRDYSEQKYDTEVPNLFFDEFERVGQTLDLMKCKIIAQIELLNQHISNVEKEVSLKTRDIRMILENIQQGIFSVKDDLTIHKDYSVFVKEIFETQDIEGRHLSEFLLEKSHLDESIRSETTMRLEAGLNEPFFVYQANSGRLPKEITWDKDGQKKILELDWNPIIEDDHVDRVLVTVRDVTDIRELQKQAKKQSAELEIVSEILPVDERTFRKSMQSMTTLLDEMPSYISENSLDVDELFIRAHTIKGLARTYNLSKINHESHICEQTLGEIRQSREYTVDVIKSLRVHIQKIKEAHQSYLDIATRLLGRNIESKDAVKLNVEDLDNWRSKLIKTASKCEPSIQEEIKPVLDSINRITYATLDSVVNSLDKSLDSTAHNLGKPKPNIHVIDSHIFFEEKMEATLRNVLVHLIRNSLDHGIESPSDRKSENKEETGKIVIRSEIILGGKLVITYEDDGAGLNVARIRDIGIKKGLISDTDNLQPKDIAELIFHEGFSTRSQVTSISGRGVGMNAVRNFLTESGGAINIRLKNQVGKCGNFYQVAFEMSLPHDSYILSLLELAGTDRLGA